MPLIVRGFFVDEKLSVNNQKIESKNIRQLDQIIVNSSRISIRELPWNFWLSKPKLDNKFANCGKNISFRFLVLLIIELDLDSVAIFFSSSEFSAESNSENSVKNCDRRQEKFSSSHQIEGKTIHFYFLLNSFRFTKNRFFGN